MRAGGRLATPRLLALFAAAVGLMAALPFLVPLSPCLVFGWGPFPRLGVAGGGIVLPGETIEEKAKFILCVGPKQ